VGRGFAEQELYPQIKAMLGDRVRIISEWLNPPDYLDATDCFLCMSPNEGMPYTVIEALFHGTPVA
jgi:glycosyltransferase involved in cell wall biosynthesis